MSSLLLLSPHLDRVPAAENPLQRYLGRRSLDSHWSLRPGRAGGEALVSVDPRPKTIERADPEAVPCVWG